jgi:hypothetical protein
VFIVVLFPELPLVPFPTGTTPAPPAPIAIPQEELAEIVCPEEYKSPPAPPPAPLDVPAAPPPPPAIVRISALKDAVVTPKVPLAVNVR